MIIPEIKKEFDAENQEFAIFHVMKYFALSDEAMLIRINLIRNFIDMIEFCMNDHISGEKLMEYKGYHAHIRYSDEDKLFVGEVIGINDSLGFHGSSVDELEQMFHQSIDNYLDMCAEFGKTPDKEYKGQFNVRIPPTLHRSAVICAKQRNISLNEFVTKAIQDECAMTPA